MSLSYLITQAESVRQSISARVIRQSQADLYAALSTTLGLCEYCEAEGLTDAFKAEVIARGREGGRRSYFESEADIYLIMGRFCFSDGKAPYGSRCNAWRYTATLREAHKRQIKGADLTAWLTDNGGVNALFQRRPVETKTMTRKTLHLTESITIEKGKPFTITLCSNGDGFFDVIS